MTDTLTRLAQRGREAGIHLIAATQHPSAALLGSVMRANFPLRLVGRVAAAQDALVSSGRGGTDAHLLHGRGDFLAVSGDQLIRFQVANITEKEFKQAPKHFTNAPKKATDAPDDTRGESLSGTGWPVRGADPSRTTGKSTYRETVQETFATRSLNFAP